MKFSIREALRWLILALLISVLPLGIAILGPLPLPRAFWTEFGVALGFVGMGLLVLLFFSSGRLAWIAPKFGADVVLQAHKRIGIMAVGMVLAHPLIMILSDVTYLKFLDPRVNFWRALALGFVTVALVAVLVTSLWREPVGLTYEWWRLIHGFLALAIVFMGMVHGLQVGHYLDSLPRQALWTGLSLGAMALVILTRVIRPWRSRKRPYQIVEVQSERGNACSLWLEPVDHDGMNCRAGQYVWITVGDRPFRLQQHPFSISSGENRKRIRLTAAALGDFTRTWKDLQPGTRVYLEGPFGAFTLEPDARGNVFIVGGIGVTPAMSLLQTLQAAGDQRPAFLIYGNPTWEDATFPEEIGALEKALPLTTVHVLEEAPEDWSGETGLIDQALLDRHLPDDRGHYNYYLCGPSPMMDSAEKALRQLGVSWRRIYSERFQIV
jgi:predicted ferric reductase